jgi:hypothetical protein
MTELFITEKRKVSELVPYEKNPRKISSKEKRELEERLNKYGLIGLPSMDADGRLIGGHQCLKSMLMLGWGEKEIDVRVASRKLTEKEFAEVLLIDNEHSAVWDLEALQKDFSDLVDLDSFGFSFDDISKTEGTEKIEPEYPIVPKMSEKYSAVVIVIENSIDENFVRSVLGLDVNRCYKTENVGESYVLTAKQFIEKWNKKN